MIKSIIYIYISVTVKSLCKLIYANKRKQNYSIKDIVWVNTETYAQGDHFLLQAQGNKENQNSKRK